MSAPHSSNAHSARERSQKPHEHLARLKKLNAEHKKIKNYRKELHTNVALIKSRHQHRGEHHINERINEYLGGKSLSSWSRLYKKSQKRIHQERLACFFQFLFSFLRQPSTLIVLALLTTLIAITAFILSTTSLLGNGGPSFFKENGVQEEITKYIEENPTNSGDATQFIVTDGLSAKKITRIPQSTKLSGSYEEHDVLEVQAKPEIIHASYGTPVEILKNKFMPAGVELSYRITNNKALENAYVVVSEGSSIVVVDAEGKTIPVEEVGLTTDFVDEWSANSGFIGDIRRELEAVGVETDLALIFAPQQLPVSGEEMRLFVYPHPQGSSVTVDIRAPPKGKILFLDPIGIWWNSTWAYKRLLNVSNNYAGDILTGYSVTFTIDTQSLISAGKMRSDCGDLRLVWYYGSEEFVLDTDNVTACNTTATTYWFMLQQDLVENENDAATYSVYYGNPFATALSVNKSNIYYLWEDFEDQAHPFTDGSMTINVNESAAKNGNYGLEGYGAGGYRRAVVPENLTRGFIIEGWVNSKSAGGNADLPGLEVGMSSVTERNGYEGILDWRSGTGTTADMQIRENYATAIASSTENTVATNTWYYMRLSWSETGDLVLSVWNESLSLWGVSSVTDPSYTTGYYGLGAYKYGAWDDIKVRLYVSNEPTVVALDEIFGGSLNITLDDFGEISHLYRGEAFTMNATAICEVAVCGQTSAWAQYLAIVNPEAVWREHAQENFSSYNISTNISIGSMITLQTNLSPEWWSSSYLNRNRINISAQGSVLPQNYTVSIFVNTTELILNNKLQVDGDDLRIVYWNGVAATELDRVNVTPFNMSATEIRFRLVEAIASNSSQYFFYYNNPSASSPPADPDNVYLLWEDFEDDTLGQQPAAWSLGSGDWVVALNGANKVLRSEDTVDDYDRLWLASNPSWSNITVDFNTYLTSSTGIPFTALLFRRQGTTEDQHFAALSDLRTGGPYYVLRQWDGGYAVVDSDATNYATNQWHSFHVKAFGDNILMYRNGTLYINNTGPAYWPTGNGIGLLSYSAPNLFDDIIVRYAVENDPVTSLLGEEAPLYLAQGEYISDSFDTGAGSTLQNIYWGASTPQNTTLRVYSRSSNDDISWSSWFLESNDTLIDAPNQRYVQYRLLLNSTVNSSTPVLSEMNIAYVFPDSDYVTMTGATDIVASNPAACGLMYAGDTCNPSLILTPQTLGMFTLRYLANVSDTPIFGVSDNASIEVYARTSLLDLDVSPSIQAQAGNVTIQARLMNDFGQALSGRPINFTDTTDSLYLGNATTDASGYAYLNYELNASSSIGSHTISILFEENATDYLERVNDAVQFTVSSTPNVSAQIALPSVVGIGDTLTLSADVSDSVGVHTVWVNVTRPDNTWTVYTMSGSGNDTYVLSFSDTWDVGTYFFKVSANNTDGIVYDPSGNFTVNVSATIFADPEFDEYENFQTVQINPRRVDGWWDNEWMYRSQLLVQGTNAALTEYQVDLVLDTQTLINAGKLQNACEDLRFVSSKYIYGFPVVMTNDLGTPMNNHVVTITITDPTIISHMAADGHDVRVFSSSTETPYVGASDYDFWFVGGSSSSVEMLVLIPYLADGAQTTLYVYYGDDDDATTESNYSAIHNIPIAEIGTTAATGSWNTTNFSISFNQTPIVVGSLMTQNDPAEAALRLDNVSTLGFQAIAEESVTLDGVHSAEKIGYAAFEPGRWYVGANLIIANTSAFDNPTGSTYNVISFLETYSSAPQFLHQVQTYAESDPVNTRCQGVGASTVSCKLEETDSDTAHAEETIGWVAFPAGTFATNTGDLIVGAFSTTHTPLTVTYPSITNAAVIAKLDTENGGDNTHERMSAGPASADIFAEEVESADGAHTSEDFSYLVAEEGILYGRSDAGNPSFVLGEESTTYSQDTELDYYIEGGCNTTSTNITLQVASIPENDDAVVYYYYGNPSATIVSNLSATMSYSSPQTIGYVAQNNFASTTMTVYSLVDDNAVVVGTSSDTLAKRGSLAVSSPAIGEPIKVSGHVQVESTTDGTDIISPSTWAGTEFIYNWRRNIDDFTFVSPWGTANVSIYDAGSLIDNFLVDETGVFVDNTYDIGDATVMYITSDIPILVQHSSASNDVTPMYPATSEPLFGIPSGNVRTSAGANGATVYFNRSSGGALATAVLGAWAVSSTGNGGADGNAPALRVVSNGTAWPVGTMQQADGDGNEATIFLPERQLGTILGSSQQPDHIAVAAPTLGTNCTVYNNAGTYVGSALSTGDSIISFIGFGVGNDNTYGTDNWIMECTNPVFAIFDNDAQDDEQHLMSIRDMRQYHYPSPNISVVAETEEEVFSGLKNTGAQNITGYLYLAVQENSTGSWSTITPPVYQDFTPRLLTPGETVNISDIWSLSGAWSTGTRSPGYYRTYAAFLDNESNLLVDGLGNELWDFGLFRIKLALITLVNLTHENGLIALDEYEAGDTIDWINVTVTSNNNTAISAAINLTLLDGAVYAGWGPNSEQTCGNIAPEGACTRQWDNAGTGYPVPLTTPSGTYTFNWSVAASADNADDYLNNVFTIAVHNIPDTFNVTLSPTRISTLGSPAQFNFTFTNLWSQDISSVNVTLNCPAVNLNCSCGGGSESCFLGTVSAGATVMVNYTIDANESSTPGNYYPNITLTYTNPQETRLWAEQESTLLEVREQGIMEISLNETPLTLTRTSSGIFRAYMNNTAEDNATNATLSYTLPSGFTNTSALSILQSLVGPGEVVWLNLTFNTSLSTTLGPRTIRIDTQSDQGQEDFIEWAVTVYANTSISSFTINDTNVSRGEYLLLTARLLRDDGVPLSGQTINFSDQTDGYYLGSGVTNGAGYASKSVLVNNNSSLGLHTFNATFAGNTAQYYHPSKLQNVSEIGLRPNITDVTALPNPQGPGSNVTIKANVSDDDVLTNVSVTINYPGGGQLQNNMTLSGGYYEYVFGDTWKNGTYTFTIFAQDETGSEYSYGGNFTITMGAFIELETIQTLYAQNDNVFVTGHGAGWWFNRSWAYKRNITISSDNPPLPNATVQFTLDTATLITESKMNTDCSDIRIFSGTSEVSFYLEDCDTNDTTIFVRVPLLDGVVSLATFYGYDNATSVVMTSEDFFSGRAYVLSDSLATGTLDVASYYNNTDMCLVGGGSSSCVSLDASGLYSWPSTSLNATYFITSNKYFSSGFSGITAVGDAMTPIGLAGREFVYPAPRSRESLDFFAPFTPANVLVYDGGGTLRGNLTLAQGSWGEVNYDFTDDDGIRVFANTSVLGHFESELDSTDYMPMRPGSTELYGILGSSAAYVHVACLYDATQVTAYFSNGSTQVNACDSSDTINYGAGGSQGAATGVYVVANNSVGGMHVADGDGGEGVVWLEYADLDYEYVIPQDAEYISIVPITPNTRCDLYSATGTPLVGQTSTAYTPPRPQTTIRFTGTPISAGARLVCNSTVFAYYEYNDENTETNLFGRSTFLTRPENTTVQMGSEQTRGSLISNTGGTDLRGSLLLTIEKYDGTWLNYATLLNESASATIQTIPANGYLDIGAIWNATPWNVGNAPQGEYRAYASLLDNNGSVLVESQTPFSALTTTSAFNVSPPNINVNLTAITIYDVTDSLSKHIYTSEIVDNGTNATFILESGRGYRVEFHVKTDATGDPWEINTSTIKHVGLNSSWLVDSGDIWYKNESDVAERIGGTFNGTITWNSSLNGVSAPGSTTVFYYILNLSNAPQETLGTQFIISDPLFFFQDYSQYKILIPDSTPPSIIAPYDDNYNLTNYSIVRGNNLTIFGHWNEELQNATVLYNITSVIQEFSVTLPSPNPQNYSNYTITTSSVWGLGAHVTKLKATDLLGNQNSTLPYFTFSVWGLARVASGSVSNSTPAIGDLIKITCQLTDTTNGLAIANYPVSFYNGTDLLGVNSSNSSGTATFTFQDNSPGVEQVSCVVSSNASRFYYAATQNNYSTMITTKELEPPQWFDQSSLLRAYKGDIISLDARWTDNFQLSGARLFTNASGVFAPNASLSLSGIDAWANFSYVIPTTLEPGVLAWYQRVNDTSNNTNTTDTLTFEIWGWAEVVSMTLDPSSMSTTNTTDIACLIDDANSSMPLVGYIVEFYNETDLLGANVTNATGWAHYSYTDFSAGQEAMRCQIYENVTRQYNVSLNNATKTLNTVEGADIYPPTILGGNYGINATTGLKGSHFLVSAQWIESINNSLARYNVSSPTYVTTDIPPPYIDDWTNISLQTNSSWKVGAHKVRIEVEDQAGNQNNTLPYLNFTLTATINTSWLSPSGDQEPGMLQFLCLVSEEQGGAPVSGYTVYFYNGTGSLLGTNTTNASGVAMRSFNASSLSGAREFSCRVFASPSEYYYLGSPFSANTNLYFDTQAPSIVLNEPTNNSLVEIFTLLFNFTATDDHDSLLSCNLSIDGVVEAENVSATSGVKKSVLTTISSGLHDWNVTCVDDAGNRGFSNTFSFNMTQPDITPPNVTLLSPLNGSFVTGASVVFNYSASDDTGLQTCELYIDGTLNDTHASPSSPDSFTVVNISEGAHVWAIRCIDLGMNENTTANESFVVDSSSPTPFSLLSPSDGVITKSFTAELSWQATTDDNFENYSIQIALDTAFSSIVANYYSYGVAATKMNVSFGEERTYYWRVIAYDAAGNSYVAPYFTYAIDLSGPAVSLFSPAPNAYLPNASMTFYFDVFDYAVNGCSLFTNMTGSWSATVVNASINTTGRHTFFTTLSENASTLWNVQCNDSLNNHAFALQNRTVFTGPAQAFYDNTTIPVNLTINNVAPSVVSFDLPATIDLVAGDISDVFCNATVADDNGVTDIALVSAQFYHSSVAWGDPDDNATHYTNASCSCSPVDASSLYCSCYTPVLYYANAGSWSCRVNVSDYSGANGVGSDTLTINTLLALVVQEQLIDYGTLTNTESDEQNVTVQNLGNVPIDISLFGFGASAGDNLAMVCDLGSVPVSFERFSLLQGTPYTSMTSLTGNPSARDLADITLAPQTDTTNVTDSVYWRLGLAPGAKDICNGTVVFQSEVNT